MTSSGLPVRSNGVFLASKASRAVFGGTNLQHLARKAQTDSLVTSFRLPWVRSRGEKVVSKFENMEVSRRKRRRTVTGNRYIDGHVQFEVGAALFAS